MNKKKKASSEKFIQQLVQLRFLNAFNPYADCCPDYDDSEAVAIRRKNLRLVLDSALENGVDSIWIGRDLGYRGGRRTGLALTDEVHLDSHASLFRTPPLLRATRGPIVAERTAGVVWKMLTNIGRPIFLWNVVPLHPHEPGDPMSNRCHTREERSACLPLLIMLIGMLQPKNVIAVGNDALSAMDSIGLSAIKIRHPSYGGQTEFMNGLTAIYDL